MIDIYTSCLDIAKSQFINLAFKFGHSKIWLLSESDFCQQQKSGDSCKINFEIKIEAQRKSP
jgi:hypothetical protein